MRVPGVSQGRLIEARSEAWVFATSSGVRPNSLHTSFELLLADADMRVDPTSGKNPRVRQLIPVFATFAPSPSI
jgi:hypothetical protein